MGITYRARDTRLLVEVVLKVIRPETGDDETTRLRFVREARAAARVRHPNVAAVLHLHDEPPCFYAMEFVNGSSLRDLLKERGTLPAAEALEYTQQAAAALAAIERERLVHRDLKPANLMLVADPERPLGQRLVLIDFGLARGVRRRSDERVVTLAEALSAEGEFTGTPLYASPEQAAGVDELDIRSDVYSLGIVLWQMVVGAPPFVGATPLQTLSMQQFREPPWERLEALSPTIQALLRRMLAKEPGDRLWPAELRQQIHEAKAFPAPSTPPVVRPLLSPAAGSGGAGRGFGASAGNARSHGRGVCPKEPDGWASPPVGRGCANRRRRAGSILAFLRPSPPAAAPSPALTAPGATPAGISASAPVKFQNDLGMRFIEVPAAMVSFSVWETRVRDYEAFLADSGYQMAEGETTYIIALGAWRRWFKSDWKTLGFAQTSEDPVVGVSWEDAGAFCRWLSRRERAAGRIGADREFRLPTDKEWSAAAGLRDEIGASAMERDRRAPEIFVWGTAWPPPPGAGNFSDESSDVHQLNREWQTIPGYRDGFSRTAPVGQFPASASGLHDLAGNVWEWCQDGGDDAANRIARGGSWFNSSKEMLRAGARLEFPATRRMADVGFRVVLAPAGN